MLLLLSLLPLIIMIYCICINHNRFKEQMESNCAKTLKVVVNIEYRNVDEHN